MSRSYKKQLGFVDRHPFGKNQANRRVRRKPVDYDMQNGRAYQKEYQSWNICDFKSLYFGPDCLIREHFIRWGWTPEGADRLLREMRAK